MRLSDIQNVKYIFVIIFPKIAVFNMFQTLYTQALNYVHYLRFENGKCVIKSHSFAHK